MLQTTPSTAQDGYQKPPEVISKLIKAPSTPSVSIDSKAEWMLLMERPGYPSIEEVAAPELESEELNNPATNGRSRQSFMIGLTLKNIKSGESFEIKGLPTKPQLGNVAWSFNERKWPLPIPVSMVLNFGWQM